MPFTNCLSRCLLLSLLLAMPLGLRAQDAWPAGLPGGLNNPDSLRAWQPGPPTADTVRLRQLLEGSRRCILTNLDSAQQLARQAVALAWSRRQQPGLENSLNVLAATYYYADNHIVTQRMYELLLQVTQRSGNADLAGNAYLGLGNVARDLDDWAGAERYFVRAQRQYEAARPPLPKRLLAVLINRAYNYVDVDSTRRARPLIRQALALLRQIPQTAHGAKAYQLLGMVQEKEGRLDSAAASFRQTVRLATSLHDLNAEAEGRQHLAQLLLRRPRPDYAQALGYARQAQRLFHALGDAQEAETIRTQAEALHALDRPEAYATLLRAQAMFDSVNTAQRAAAVATAQARFAVAEERTRVHDLEQERRIEELQQAQRALRTRVAVAAAVVLTGLLLALGLWQYRRRQQRREDALRRQLAADLHDDVGGLLSRIALQTDLMQEGLGAPELQHAQLAEVAGNSRLAVRQLNDVVWSLDARNDSVPNLLDRLRDYAHEVLVPTGRDVRFVADDALGSSPSLSAPLRRGLYLIYKEALHNVLKYAPTDATVTVSLHRAADGLHLDVVNSGPPAALTRGSGHGLRNMRERAAALGGSTEAGPEPAGGFAVRVRVPG